MKYEVVLLKRAEQELRAAAAWIAEHSPEAAQQWFNHFVAALLTLEQHPQRCGIAPENSAFPCELRQLIFRRRGGRAYRAIFTITPGQVRVLRIRGPGQDFLRPE